MRHVTILKRVIERLFRAEGRNLQELTYVFCSDEYILDINRRFLHHDFYTDIISFDLSRSIKAPLLGEVYISLDTVRSNAASLGISFHAEILRVIFHGPLHFCGYSDKSKKAKVLMRKMEDAYLAQFQIAVKRST